VGRRGGATPGLSLPGGLNTEGEDTHRPSGMPIVISSWMCRECGQMGELIESREVIVETHENGHVGEFKRDPYCPERAYQEMSFYEFFAVSGIAVLLLEFMIFWIIRYY
jgi:hypothetical protein